LPLWPKKIVQFYAYVQRSETLKPLIRLRHSRHGISVGPCGSRDSDKLIPAIFTDARPRNRQAALVEPLGKHTDISDAVFTDGTVVNSISELFVKSQRPKTKDFVDNRDFSLQNVDLYPFNGVSSKTNDSYNCLDICDLQVAC